jgi:hypothetical protein
MLRGRDVNTCYDEEYHTGSYASHNHLAALTVAAEASMVLVEMATNRQRPNDAMDTRQVVDRGPAT